MFGTTALNVASRLAPCSSAISPKLSPGPTLFLGLPWCVVVMVAVNSLAMGGWVDGSEVDPRFTGCRRAPGDNLVNPCKYGYERSSYAQRKPSATSQHRALFTSLPSSSPSLMSGLTRGRTPPAAWTPGASLAWSCPARGGSRSARWCPAAADAGPASWGTTPPARRGVSDRGGGLGRHADAAAAPRYDLDREWDSRIRKSWWESGLRDLVLPLRDDELGDAGLDRELGVGLGVGWGEGCGGGTRTCAGGWLGPLPSTVGDLWSRGA